MLGLLEKWRNGLVDSFTRLWAKGIEEGRKDGDGSSPGMRGWPAAMAAAGL
jgi:hypothetical protein